MIATYGTPEHYHMDEGGVYPFYEEGKGMTCPGCGETGMAWRRYLWGMDWAEGISRVLLVCTRCDSPIAALTIHLAGQRYGQDERVPLALAAETRRLTCGECRFWEVSEPGKAASLGWCRRNAPLPDSSEVGFWPITGPKEWCGEGEFR